MAFYSCLTLSVNFIFYVFHIFVKVVSYLNNYNIFIVVSHDGVSLIVQ